MKLTCGIVGLPNVGKSTIFSALTKAPAEAANYPFCTIDPNIGIVDLPDERLDFMASVFQPKKKIPATVDFVDIAGLIKGASSGEGLGNKFLANIRETAVIAHVVRCFDNPDIQHVRDDAKTEAPVDPESDILTIDFELAQADLDTIAKRAEKITKQIRALGKDEEKRLAPYFSAVEKIKPLLTDGKCARMADLTDEEKNAVYDLHLLTIKPQVFICNIDEDTIPAGTNKYVETVQKIAKEQKSEAIVICGKFEADLAEIDDENDRKEFMESAGLKESGLSVLAKHVYHLMGLRTFFTGGSDECRAWTIHEGDKAPQAAGVIHTDFEKGFIKAEAYTVNDLKQYGSEAKIKEAGKYRQEGKDYVVQDGDVLFFKFNV
ncbi:redox-regulated ATPase YchF [Treponema succinifaciens]|uniref:Ribosome-binding ATPase YchF n=2 Tax=Treponema TaxID=157 RepID=F2NTL5_TRES6|nr:redox-regulated ATPase YchF [Treponema succinifaciens]AEB15004.1 GTP-binding protein YchF [Treponema succinifaciens DSM 2489]MCI6911913.1 redox-regulated ATPase YchF [Treponema succinifaciens]MDD6962827.1 redox-regulated ATPase YchF [Treponema succinifaciens]MDY5116653.1 redox-regulated ATPase YchF [Treponema succinifaciens]UKI56138.1 MAG: redox-regulated ATPase YchF [Treponema succinifaciens]